LSASGEITAELRLLAVAQLCLGAQGAAPGEGLCKSPRTGQLRSLLVM